MRDFRDKWESNRKRLYSLLIHLVKDIDLADDLLQDVYIHASEKVDSYRGGDFGAWLAAIAKNVAFAHLRRAYVKAETVLVEGFDDAVQEDTGTDSHLESMLLRKAVRDLSPVLRSALILKHYGGFNYSQIAVRLDCPVGTAKRRVWTAIRQLRSALGVMENIQMKKCAKDKLLDYAYGLLTDKNRDALEVHLAKCETCRAELRQLKQVIGHLEAARDQMVFVDVTDINQDGSSTTYSSWKVTNETDESTRYFEFDSMNYHRITSIFIGSEETSFTAEGEDDGEYNHYKVQLKRALAPGESTVQLVCFTTPEGIGASLDIGHSRRIAIPDNSGTDSSDHLLVQMVRLPEDAKLIGSVPASDEVRQNSRITLVWQRLVKAGEYRERPVVVYSV